MPRVSGANEAVKMTAREETEMFIAGIVLDPSSNAPIVILKDATGRVCVPIWIGVAEATAIASVLKKIDIARPMTHDLFVTTVEQLGAKVSKVYIRSIENSTFYADVEISIGDSLRVVDARPSDALALAVRTGARITVANDVLAKSQVTLVAVNPEELNEVEFHPEDHPTEGQNFASIEKEKWEEILAEMDPEDFKYKM